MKKKDIRRFLKENPVYIRSGVIVTLSILAFAAVYTAEQGRSPEKNSEGREILKRGDHGEGSEELAMKVQIGDINDEIQVNVSEKIYTDEELDKVFSEVSEKLETLILGENESLDEVRADLDLITAVPDTGILVSWELDNYEVMDIQGNLKRDHLTEDGTIVQLTALLRYGEKQTLHSFCAMIFPPKLNRTEKLMEQLERELENADKKTASEEYMILPDRLNGEKIKWTYEESTMAFGILALGGGAACMLCVSDRQKKKEAEKKKIERMKADYPQIINKFTLYIGAGMTVRRAWFCIAMDYQRERKKEKKGKAREAYEEMVFTMNKISGGGAEADCYEEYGIRCGSPLYRKFGTMLAQNMRKGSKGLTELLKKEADEAFEERKNNARKLGEEAGTKLMIPMFIMLAIVFVIVMIPALFTIQI